VVSIGNYWKGLLHFLLTKYAIITYHSLPIRHTDPDRLDKYLEKNIFLPKLDLPTNNSYRDNFMAIEDLVLIGGPDDGVITPWQSRWVQTIEFFQACCGGNWCHENTASMVLKSAAFCHLVC